MAGTTIPLISRRNFGFESLQANTSQTIILINEFDVSAWTEGVLNVRVHGGTIDTSATAQVTVGLYATSPTASDPTEMFIDTTPVASVDIAKADVDASPKLLRASLSAGFGGKLCLKITGTQDTTAPLANLDVSLSAEIVLKA